MRKTIRNGILFSLAVGAIFFTFYRYVFFTVTVPSLSMYPTIGIDDRIVITRIHDKNSIKRGNVLVFYSDEFDERMIKRVIGLPNDHITIDKVGTVFVNGKELAEPYVEYPDNRGGEYQVPEDSYFFLGDARAHSLDSRSWFNPYIEGNKIEGKSRFIFYPFDSWAAFSQERLSETVK